MRKMMFAAFLFCFIHTYAKTPIPEALLNAKTAVVRNDGAETKDFDKFCKFLKEWGRFELVQNRGGADIVIALSSRIENRNVQLPNIGGSFGGVRTEQVIISFINIFSALDDTQLWADKTAGESRDPKQLVDKLKNKLKKK